MCPHPVEESPESKWTPIPLPEHNAAKLLKEKEAQEKLEMQTLVDLLSTEKPAALVDMWKPQKDDKKESRSQGNTLSCRPFGVSRFESLSAEERVRFRIMVEQLVAQGPKKTRRLTRRRPAPLPCHSVPSHPTPRACRTSSEVPANPQAPDATPEVTTSSRPLTVRAGGTGARQTPCAE